MNVQPLNPFFGESSLGQQNQPKLHAASQTVELYERSRLLARLRQAWGRLTGRPDALIDLDSVRRSGRLRGVHSAGLRVIPVREIRGSLGRAGDFDLSFRPLHDRTRGRWLSVAQAMLNNIALPPVELIQAGEDYFVQDGHHRISVARALGQEVIDAEVTVWKLATQVEQARSAPQVQPELCPIACPI